MDITLKNLRQLLRVVQANHRYHQEVDDTIAYSESGMCADNLSTIAYLEGLIRKAEFEEPRQKS
jgi:hypothetical protein